MCLKKSDMQKIIVIPCNFETDILGYVSSVTFVAENKLHTKSLEIFKFNSCVLPPESHQLVDDFISTLTQLNFFLENCLFCFPDLKRFEDSFLTRSSHCFAGKKIEKIYRDDILHEIKILIFNKELHFVHTKDYLPEVLKCIEGK